MQYKLFSNAVPHRSSLLGTWLLLIHMFLAFTGGPLLLIIYYGIGSSDTLILRTIGIVGITLGVIIVVAVVSTLKVYKILGLILLLVAYCLGTWFSFRIINWAPVFTFSNFIGMVNPIFLGMFFFPISGFFMVGLVLFTLYATSTKKEVNYCYHCHITYNFKDQFCESCGTSLLPCYITKKRPKLIFFSQF